VRISVFIIPCPLDTILLLVDHDVEVTFLIPSIVWFEVQHRKTALWFDQTRVKEQLKANSVRKSHLKKKV